MVAPGENLARFALTLVSAILISISFSPVVAQIPDLTPEQRAMLNQLPPAQRQQALRTLEQARQQGGQTDELSKLSEELSSQAAAEAGQAGDEDPSSVPRARGGSRLIVSLYPREDLSRQDAARLEADPVLQRILGSRYYELDDKGVLALPGLPTIPLLGLTEEHIQNRLGAEPDLGVFDVIVSLLATPSEDAEGLEPFGYDFFESIEQGFEPVSTGPVPPDYVLGPGDTVRVQLFGNVNGIYEYEVTRDGVLNLPELGPMTVVGLPFSEFRADVNRRVQQMLIGTQVSVTMGQLRTIRIFVLGDANRPGSYVVNSLSTISSALYYSGGISRVGSLRDIQLKRNGNTVARLDLYELLLDGDTSGDSRLQPGDAIFIPPVGPQVSVAGAVKRPAIYEIDGVTFVADIVRLAGGLQPDAFPDGAYIERIEPNQNRRVVSISADGGEATASIVQPGDALTVPRILPDLEDTVTLVGHVQRPGPYQWRRDMRLVDLIGSELELQPGADTDYVLIRREESNNRHIHAISANLTVALREPESIENIRLQPRDTVHVFGLAYGRQRVIGPILEELKLQARFGEPYQQVSVSGEVRAPGEYPLEPGMRVSDLIRAGGDLAEEAYALKAELARYEVVDGEYRNTEVFDVDLDAILRGVESADTVLEEHDNLRISTLPEWDTLWAVTLEGEVRFPGIYRIRRGETLRQVLERAGGLTEAAFPEGAIFLRESLREREQEQIEILARRLEADLTSLSLQTIETTGSEALETGRELLSRLRATEAVGRLVIDLEALSARARNGEPSGEVELRDDDRLLVPKFAQEVTVIGETQQNTSHLYQPGLTREDYIQMSGGLTRRADRKLIYVVRASGAVVTNNRSKWLGRRGGSEIRPGDTIVVPLETDKIRPLTFWTNVTQILYQASIAVAAISSFDD